MTRAELIALAEHQIVTAAGNLDAVANGLAKVGKALAVPEAIAYASAQAQLATAAIDLARLK